MFDLNEKMPHTYPKREDDDVYEPVYVRPQGIVSLEDMKQKNDQDKEQENKKKKKRKKKKKKKKKKKSATVDIGDTEEITNDVSDERVVEKKLEHKRFFRVGAYVEARVRGWEGHYLGKILSKHKDEFLFYTIEFENGEKHENISCRRVRKIKKQRMRTNEKFSPTN